MTNEGLKLPSYSMLDLEGYLQPAGTPAQQIAMKNLAWTMLETYRTPDGGLGSRLSNEWLGEQKWYVQIIPHHQIMYEDSPWLLPLCLTLQEMRVFDILGTYVSPPAEDKSTVWQLKIDREQIGTFFNNYRMGFHLLYCQARRFAIHGNDGDYAVYAGSEKFIRAALPPIAVGSVATAKVIAGIEEEHGPGCMDGILEHYAPFMID